MYERVVIVGVEFVREEREEADEVARARVRVQCVNEKGKSRPLVYELEGRPEGWAGAHAPGYRASGSMSRLLAAAGIQSDEQYDEMLQALAAGDLDRAMRAEGRVESRVMEVMRAVAGTPAGAEQDVAADLVGLLVGRIIRIDWIQLGPYGRLAEQPANVLPSRGNGMRVFGGKPVARLVAEWQAAVRRSNEVPDLQALDAIAAEMADVFNEPTSDSGPGPVRL